ncbi:hypothetical protein KY336_00835 [Candidatus Woesearchaeota archaeon]|nr:hypothetical protein [Candidatus Woesearchaeota archaeon]
MRRKLKIQDNKKGFAITLRALAMIILVVFGLVIAYLYFIPKTSETIQGVDRHLCRTSVKAKAQTKFLKTQSPLDMNCYTRFVTAEAGKTYGHQQSDNRVTKKITSKEELREVYADELGGCFWQMGGENGQALYNPYSPFEHEGETRCVICSTIDIDQEILKKYGGTLDEFNKHLKTHNFKDVGVDIPYDRLLGLQNKQFPDIKLELGGKPMSYSAIWAISSTPAKTTVWSVGGGIAGHVGGCLVGSIVIPIPPFNLIGCVAGASVGGTAGYGAGVIHTLAEDQDYSVNVAIIPANEAEKNCAQLY